MKKHFIPIAVVLLAVIVSACSSGGSSNLPGAYENPWELISINQGNLLEGTQVTLTFEETQVTGSAGCNVYSASYEVSGNSIAFGAIVQTEMACVDIPGIMDQERMYLEMLEAAQSYEAAENMLTIISEYGQSLIFQPLPPDLTEQDLPLDNPASVSQANPIDEPGPTQPVNSIEPQAGFKEYQDASAGISLSIPEEWHVSGIVEGEYAVLTSYPEDKYVGGGQHSPNDTKCDLNLHPGFTGDAQALLDQWKSDSIASVLSEEEMLLNSGQPATRIEIDNRGVSMSVVTKIGDRVISLTCWGNPNGFNQIAPTLHASE